MGGETTRIRLGWLAASVLAPGFALMGALALYSGIDYNRWDNFEYFTPIIVEAQKQILSGHIPYWNPHQLLGEPILAAGQPGVFYFPYLLCLALARAAGSGDGAFTLSVVATHVPFASMGWFLLLSRLGVRPLLALVAATSASCGGFFTVMASVWIFTVPIAAWLPWLLGGIVSTLSASGHRQGRALVMVSLTAVAAVGHPQMVVYTWIFAIGFALAQAAWVEGREARLARLGLPFLAAALLSAPSMLPVWALVRNTARASPVSKGEFLSRSVAPETVMDLLLPVYRTYNGFLATQASVTLYQGGWIVPAIAVASLLGVRRRRARLQRSVKPNEGDDRLVRCFEGSCTMALLFLWLSMGTHGGLYALTYGLPVWSSFRWPFKFLTYANSAFILAAACALEITARREPVGAPTERVVLGGFLPVVLALLWRRPSPLLFAPAGWTALATALAAASVVPYLCRRWARLLLAAVVLSGSVALIVLSHQVGMKRYPEPYGEGAAVARVTEPGYRVLPLGPDDSLAKEPGSQELGLYHSATACGFDSVTGTTWGLGLSWYRRWLPSEISGVIALNEVAKLLGSNLLRSFNARYVIARKGHAPSIRAIESVSCYRKVAELAHALVYEDLRVLPRAYFADGVFPYSEEGLRRGMIANEAPLRSAFVEGLEGKIPGLAGRVLRAAWRSDEVVIDVDTRERGFLVLSMTFYPDWRASIDGVPAELYRVNGVIQGLFIPAGARRVKLEYRSEELRSGLALALLGLAVGVIAVLWPGGHHLDPSPARPGNSRP